MVIEKVSKGQSSTLTHNLTATFTANYSTNKDCLQMSSTDIKKAQGNMYHYTAEVCRLLNTEHPEIYKERIWNIVVSRLEFELNLAIVGIMTLSYNKMQPLAIELARAMAQLYLPCIMLSVGEEMVHINKQLNPALVSMR